MLPSSSDDLKFRWVSRLVLGASQNTSEEFKCTTASALRLHVGKFDGNETDEDIANSLNQMVFFPTLLFFPLKLLYFITAVHKCH